MRNVLAHVPPYSRSREAHGLRVWIRTALRGRDDVVEKKMFGSLTFIVADKMACGVFHDELVVRVGPDGYQSALAEPHTRPMDFTGRPMRGMVYIDPAGIASDADLAHWVHRAVTGATSAGSGRSA